MRASASGGSGRAISASAAAASSTTCCAAACADQPESTRVRITLSRRTASSSYSR